MAGYDQIVKVAAKHVEEARGFFSFIQKVGRKYTRPVKVKYTYHKRGRFFVTIDGGAGAIDALLQELLINRGLYYYSCTKPHRSHIDAVIVPVFRQLIDNRFLNPRSRYLRKHILGKHAQIDFIPTNILNRKGYEFEILFRKWDLKAISNKDYIIALDAILTNFLLECDNHVPGLKSDMFEKVLNRVKSNFVIDSETETAFNEIHKTRTGGLHRLENPKTSEEIYSLSLHCLRYFQFLDDFIESQKKRTVVFRGKRYKRIKYGDEKLIDENGMPYTNEFGEPFKRDEIFCTPCHDCFVRRGQYHVDGCDAEVCPKCGGQMISYDCGVPSD